MASTSETREFWRIFIDMYKSLPSLWKVKSDEYKDRNLKSKCYQKMAMKLKEIEPNADREMVRKKINTLRSNYRRELKKVKKSEKCAVSPQEVYVPSLWYFKELQFLEDQEMHHQAAEDTSSVDFSDFIKEQIEIVTEDLDSTEVSFIEDDNQMKEIGRFDSVEKISSQRKKRKIETEHKRFEMANMDCETFYESDDEAEMQAKMWTLQYRKLQADQQIYAKKAIDDVLFEGRLGTLNRYSVLINKSPTPPLSNFETRTSLCINKSETS